MNNKIIKQVMVALFFVMVIMQPQNAKGADVFLLVIWATILHLQWRIYCKLNTSLNQYNRFLYSNSTLIFYCCPF